MPAPHHSVFKGRMPFLPPNQQRQSTEGSTRMSQYQECKTNLDYTEARDTGWQVSTSLQTDNYASTPKHSFLQAGCPSCRPTNSAKALKTN